MSSIGKRLRVARKAYTHELTQGEAAEYVGMPRSRLSLLENDKAILHLDEATRLADLYEVTLSWLATGGGVASDLCPDPRLSHNSYIDHQINHERTLHYLSERTDA